MKEKITLRDYNKALERIEMLLEEVDDSTPLNTPPMIELLKASEIVEAYESIHYKILNPTFLEKMQFYFEQLFQCARRKVEKDSKVKPTLFNDDDLKDLRNIVNDFDDQEWEWDYLSDEKLRKANQRNVHADNNEKSMLERHFYKKNANTFLSKLNKSSQKGKKKYIVQISKARDLFINTHMAYKGFVGTIEYSYADKMYFGKLLNIKDLVLYEAYRKEYLRASFYQAVEQHLETLE